MKLLNRVYEWLSTKVVIVPVTDLERHLKDATQFGYDRGYSAGFERGRKFEQERLSDGDSYNKGFEAGHFMGLQQAHQAQTQSRGQIL